MTKTESITIPAHHTIYNNFNNRDLRIDFAIPSEGTNEQTGIFIFVPGFGGHIDSNVYKKMREQFADNYNMVTVQCDYFGSKFMQKADTINFENGIDSIANLLDDEELTNIRLKPDQLLSILSTIKTTIPVKAKLDESLDEFVDMSFMQAIDLITTLEAIQIILRENDLLFDENNIVGFGQSQGAYLLHLSNFLAPHLFSKIIDNAAWVRPEYLFNNRLMYISAGNCTLAVEFDYIGKKIIRNPDALSLHNLYKSFNNGTYIYSCVGTTDNLVNVEDKQKSLKNLSYIDFEIIDQEKVDGTIFKSTNHGLDADYLKLVEYVMLRQGTHINRIPKLEKYTVSSNEITVQVDYSKGLPIFILDSL